MLGLAEYSVLSQELYRLGSDAEKKIGDQLLPDTTKTEAIDIAKEAAFEYYDNYEQLLQAGLVEIADNATAYYGDKTGIEMPKDFSAGIVVKAYEEDYFGATLAKRLLVNRRRLERNITRTAQVGTDALKGLITDPIPFGSQHNIDKRVLLASAVKIEQDVVKEFVDKHEEDPLIRWTLSSFHAVPDICDDLANSVDKGVVAYMKANNIDEDPKGLYTADSLPHPPHPNCQCEYHLVTQKSQSISPVKRTVRTIKNLLERFRGK